MKCEILSGFSQMPEFLIDLRLLLMNDGMECHRFCLKSYYIVLNVCILLSLKLLIPSKFNIFRLDRSTWMVVEQCARCQVKVLRLHLTINFH